MGYLGSNLAKALNRIDQIRGSVFERRFSEIVIADDGALPRRIAYAVANPVSANLVRSHVEWSGLCLYARAEAVKHEFTVFHRHRYERAVRDAERTGAYVDPNEFYETAELEVAGVGGEVAAEIERAIQEREEQARAEQKGVLGMQRVLQSSPFDRPAVQARSKMPLCFASTREAKDAFVDGWWKFVAAFRAASEAFRAGCLTALFPAHSFRPITATS
jgi:hypothetical protein